MTEKSRPSAAPTVHQLVERYLNGQPLPPNVVTADGTKLPLPDWLETLRFDRSEFSTNLASRLGLMAHPPLVCEAALTLADRITESAAS
jgi:hypothetical protein